MYKTQTQNPSLSDGRLSQSEAAVDHSLRSIGGKSGTILFIFALVFRLIYVIQSTDNPLFGVPLVDAHSYAKWAEKMVDGTWLWDHVGNYLPIYPAFLALQQMTFGSGPMVHKTLQSLMGAATTVLLAQVAARTWNRRVGLISGYFLATYWMLVIFASEKFAETFSIFFLSFSLWLLTRYRKSYWALISAGLAFALAAGVRANLFLALPGVLIWLIWLNRRQLRAALPAALLFVCGTIILIGPILARNYHLTGAPMLRAQATWSLYSGLAPKFEGLHPPVGILFDKQMNLPQQAGYFSEAEVEKFWARKLWEVIKEEPGAVALNLVRRILIFVNAREWSQEFDVAAYRAYSSFLELPWTGFWLIGPLGFLGLFLCRKPTKSQTLLIIVTIAVILSIIPFKASDRYRLPAAVMLTMFAALTVWYFFQQIKNRQIRSFFKWLVAGAILCVICWPDWLHLEARNSARHHFFIGLHYESAGRLPEAIKAFKNSMARYPWDADSPYRLGVIYARLNQKQQSLAYLKKALGREPEFPQALSEIARLHLRDGDRVTAEKYLTASLKLAPADADSLMLMAECRRLAGDQRSEIIYLKVAVEKSDDYRPALRLADRLTQIGAYEDAAGLYERVMRSRQHDKFIRATAGMLACITTARYIRRLAAEKTYLDYIIKEFDEFKFFALQAKFLNGSLSEREFRQKMGQLPTWKLAVEYLVGLDHWLKGDAASAARAFERCLLLDNGAIPPKHYSPLKWARQDLARIHKVDINRNANNK